MGQVNMRTELLQAPKYKNSTSWGQKVKNMSDSKVLGIYLSFKRRGLLQSR